MHSRGTALAGFAKDSAGMVHLRGGIAARARANAWAVGECTRDIGDRPNNAEYCRRTTPGLDDQLNSVAASSRVNAWAVGFYGILNPSGVNQDLALHSNGTAWSP